MPEPAKVAAIRALLPATGAGIYLNAGTAGPMPSETQRAMDEQAQRELAIGRAYPDMLPEILERMGEARAAVAAVIVAGGDDVALTHSVSDGLNLFRQRAAVGTRRPRPDDPPRASRWPGTAALAARPRRRRAGARRHRRWW